MFDAQIRGVGGGHANRGAAIVDGPVGVHRHVGLGAKAPIGIRSRRAQRHAIAERRQRAGDRLAQRLAGQRIGGREDVGAGLVEQAHVHVQSAARHVAVGLGQEGGLAAMRARHALHHALEAQRFVADPQRVGRMREIHLVLAGAVLGQRRSRRHVLQPARAVDLGQQRRILVEVGHRVDLRAELAAARERALRRLRQSVGSALRVDQVELVLDRDHRRQSERRESRQLILEHAARVAEEALAIVVEHAQLQLRDVGLPGHGHQRAGDGHAGTIGIAVVEAQAGVLDGAAVDVEREHRAGQRHALGEDRGECRRGRCACRAPPCSGRSRTRRRTAPSGEWPERARVRCPRRASCGSRCLLFSTPVQRRARQHMPAECAPANRPIGQIAPAQPPYRAASGLSRTIVRCGLMATLGPPAGPIP